MLPDREDAEGPDPARTKGPHPVGTIVGTVVLLAVAAILFLFKAWPMGCRS